MTTDTAARARLRERIRTVADRIEQQDQAASIRWWEQQDHSSDVSVLRGLARAWGDTLQALVYQGGLSRDEAIGVLLRTAADHCHPLARPQVVFLMPALVEAIDQRERLETGELDPRNIVDTLWGAQSLSIFERAAAVLDREIDDALAPMVTGALAVTL